MHIQKFATLISYITMIANRCGSQCLAKHDIDELGKIVVDMMPEVSTPTSHVSEEAVNTLLEIMQAKTNKVEAIRAYRVITTAGLREAKDAVERYW